MDLGLLRSPLLLLLLVLVVTMAQTQYTNKRSIRQDVLAQHEPASQVFFFPVSSLRFRYFLLLVFHKRHATNIHSRRKVARFVWLTLRWQKHHHNGLLKMTCKMMSDIVACVCVVFSRQIRDFAFSIILYIIRYTKENWKVLFVRVIVDNIWFGISL